MADQVQQQVLLEIALSLGGEADVRHLLDRSLPLIARRTGAIAAGVVRVDEGRWETVHVTPRALARRTAWRQLVAAVQATAPADPAATWSQPVTLGTAHVFRLSDYGVLIIARTEPLDPSFVQAFVPVAEVLARPLIANREQQRRTSAEVELRSLGSRYRGLLDALPFSAWLVDTEGRYLQVNSSFLAQTGHDPADIRGRSALELLPEPRGSHAFAVTQQVLRTRRPHSEREREAETGRSFEIDRTPYLDEDGDVLGVVGFRRDVTARQQTEDTLAYLASFQELVTHLAVGFVNTPVDGIDAAVDAALARVGTFAGVDRAYVFRYDFSERTASNTHEWCAAGIEPMIGELQDTPMELFPEWLDAHLAGELMHVPDVDALDPESGLARILAPQGIRTVIALPMQTDGECLGFVGFDAVRGTKQWEDGERQLLAVLAELVANAERRRLREQQLVTARAIAESAKARLELALRSGSEAIWEWDGTTSRTLLSSALLRLMGWDDVTPRYVEAASLLGVLGPQDVARVTTAVEDAIAAGEERFEVEVTGVHTAGHELPLLLRGAIDAVTDGAPERIAGVLIDRTQVRRQRAQAARHLRTQEALARLSTRFVGTEGFDAAVRHALADLGDIFGASRSYLLLRRDDTEVLDNTHEWVAPGVEPMIDRTQGVAFAAVPAALARLSRGEAVLVPDVALMPDTERADRQVYMAQGIRSVLSLPLFVAGELAGVLGVDQVEATDTWSSEDAALLRAAAEVIASALARARTDAELEQARQQAVTANAAKTRFLSMISHELRTPMNGVLGMTDLVLQGDLDQEQRRRIAAAHTSARGLLDLLDDVLDVTRIESGHLTLRVSDFDLVGLVDDAAAMARIEARRKGLRLTVGVGDDVPSLVQADPGRVRQILANLLQNAVKFTEHGGVHLDVSRAGVTGTGDDVVQLQVSDTGIGIPGCDRERVFDPFVQIGRMESRGSADGAGLGLPIVRQLAELMGGAITLDQRPGGGTTVTVTLPLPVAHGGHEHRPEVEVAGFAGLRVLVVEDNPLNQEVLRGYLDELDCRVQIASDGASALEALHEDPVDLVLMDCYMPGVDGFAATRELRRLQGPAARVPVLAVTADASAAHGRACHAAGMTGVLTKPFTRTELHRMLDHVLEHGSDGTVPAATASSGDAGAAPVEPVFDPQPLRELAAQRAADDPLVDRLVALFEAHAPGYVEQLRTAAVSGDTSAYRLAAHTLKSNARTLGLRRLATATAAAERCTDSDADAGEAAALSSRAEAVAVAVTEACTALGTRDLALSES